jgi:hypothetical protein
MSKTGPAGRALLLGAFLVLGSAPVRGADRFASTSGSDAANDCLSGASPCRTIAHALTQAVSGDTIKLAEGTYDESALTVSGSVTLTISGGWSSDFAVQNPSPKKTKIDGHDAASVLFVPAADATIDLTVDTVTIIRGTPGIRGYSSGAGSLTLTAVNVLLKSNASGSDGGGMEVTAAGTSSASISVVGATFRRNRARSVGGGLVVHAGDGSSLGLTVAGTTFLANRAFDGGGGIGAFQNGTGILVVDVDGCYFKLNQGFQPPTPGGTGGGMQIRLGASAASSVSVTNSVFVANKAYQAGGLAIYGTNDDVSIVNSSFRRNKTSGAAGGIELSTDAASSTVNVKNAIIWGNRAGGEADDLRAYPTSSGAALTVDFDHCDLGELDNTFELQSDAATFNDLGGNISTDPLLTGGDLHLRPGSPAIDTGTCTGAPGVDIDGDARPTGGGCDMGADEFVP